jgi:hypothetical protein
MLRFCSAKKTMKNRPTVFVSSTIFDFEDLRSALKHWLEGQGYEVLLSETNDFPVERSTDSYQACLDAIKKCHYFILLIGTRAGGLFDATEQVSVTRKEYRTAYELAKEGKIRIVTFVRRSVWNYRHCQKELEQFLRREFCTRKELDEAGLDRILERPSDFATHAKQIVSFIDEVARTREMKEATLHKKQRPSANWIHAFSTFQEVVDCLKIEFAIDDDERKRLEFLLGKEICENLTWILTYHEKDGQGQVVEDVYDGDIVRRKMQGDSHSSSLLSAEDLARRFFWLWLTTVSCNRMSTRYISLSIDSGVFLRYNNACGRYEQTQMSQSLWLLRQEIHSLQKMVDQSGNELYAKFTELRAYGGTSVRIPNTDLGLLLSISDRKYNILYLSKAILRAINGTMDLLDEFKAKPLSPFKDVQEELKKESPSEAQIMNWALGEGQVNP